MGGAPVLGLGRAFTVEYTDKTLVVSPTQAAPEVSKLAFNLDGSPAKTVISVGAPAKQEYEIVSQLSWEGSTLVLGRRLALKEQAVESGYRWSLDEKGYLAAESLSQFQGAGRNNATSPKAVYRKN